jgi:hypothetical protein
MNRADLHWIAEQLHSGMAPDEVCLAGVNLSAIARLELAQQALREFPTEASLWAGSNEVALPERETPINIQPFNRFPKPPPPPPPKATWTAAQRTSRPKTAEKASPLKVHWKLKIDTRRQKQRLYLELVWRQESLQNAFRDFLAGAGDWAAVEQVHLEYIDTIRDANTFISAVWDDQEAYYWARSKSWQGSNSAWAYQSWMEAWELEIPSPSLPSRSGGDADLKLDAAKTLRSIPDEPVEED